MIDPNELRIGNWYRLEGGKDYVLSLDNWMDILESYRNYEYLKGTNIEWMSGVPITNEWLERLGFKYNTVKGIASFDDDSDPDGTTHYWEIRHRSEGYISTITCVRWGDTGDIFFSNHNLRVNIHSVHQLQNLYFSLTGQELTVNP